MVLGDLATAQLMLATVHARLETLLAHWPALLTCEFLRSKRIAFRLGTGGDVLVFEANATMVVNPPDADERWAYRRPAVNKIINAVNAMIIRAAAPAARRKAG